MNEEDYEIEYTRPLLAQYQLRFMDSSARFTIVEASTKTGKTASHIIWLLEQALQIAFDLQQAGESPVGKNVWWVAPVYQQAKIAYERMKLQLVDEDGNTFFKCNENAMTLTTPQGVVIWFKTAMNPDNLYGDDVFAIVFDEFTRAKDKAWFALRSVVTAVTKKYPKYGKIKFIGNVKGQKNWGHKLAMKAKTYGLGGDKSQPDWEYFKITAYDAVEAGILDADEVASAKRDLPEDVFNELYLAEASEDGANPFGVKYIRQCIYATKVDMTKEANKVKVFGIDLARKKDFTVICGLSKLCHVVHFNRFQKDWSLCINDILNLPKVHMCCDATGVGDPIVDIIKKPDHVTGRKGNSKLEGYIFTQVSKQMLMQGLAVAIQTRKITFPPGILVDELESFEYVYTKNGVSYSAPEGMHDDCVCALALAYHCWKEHSNSGDYSLAGGGV